MVELQGDIETSSVRSRDMKNKLTLTAHLLITKNLLLGAVAGRTPEERSR